MIRNLAWAVALVTVAGCNNASTTSGPATADAQGSAARKTEAQSPVAPQVPSPAAAPADDQAAAPPQDNQPGDDVEAELMAIQRLAQTDPDQAMARAKALAEKQPDNVNVLMVAVAATQSAGIAAAQAGETGKAYPLFKDSAQFAEQLLALSNGEPPAVIASMLDNVFYNEACAFGINSDAAGALKSLQRAVDLGFSDVEMMKSDADLQVLHGTPEFEQFLASMAERAKKAAAERAEKELAEFESFDFDFVGLPAVEGDGQLNLADYKGKVLIVDFWGTWCPPCRAEIPHFIELQKKYGEQGLQIVGLNYERGGTPEEQKEKIKQFITENEMNYPCALGDEATQNMVPQFNAFPTTVFIDRSGKVRLAVVGLRPAEELEAYVTKLLEEPAS